VMGYTSGKEYAELEWPIDILITLIWVVFGWNMFGTILKRRERHLYVAIWFYIATFVTVAVLHIVNSVELPISLTKSYSWYAGVQDALVQWWYGHNAVAFFLTTPYLGLMYYFIPKAANRPVYSYRLSIIHFWALIFLYIWAGPHHLLYTSLPDWAQSLGTVFSIMLIAPSWGGMINGLLTLRGAWDRVRDDVTLKFMVVAVTAYGMATFEGPLLSLDCSACACGSIGLERDAHFWYSLLVTAPDIRYQTLFKKISQFPFLDRHPRYPLLCHSYVLGRVYPEFYVERVYTGRRVKISKLPRNC
jgi:cytochrome c oxidase cbb3-type subunit I/II